MTTKKKAGAVRYSEEQGERELLESLSLAIKFRDAIEAKAGRLGVESSGMFALIGMALLNESGARAPFTPADIRRIKGKKRV